MEGMTKDFHKIELTSRNELRVTGVSEVHSFNDEGVLLETSLGLLTVGGENIRITKLTLDQGEVAVSGEISSLTYTDGGVFSKKGGSLLSRLFK
ncbi:MAG: sporulation protein YabP [Eubacteriaceae bacterium]|jgi:sporulation protein YabP|nr:sporulation protein YabP [Eubacteriaceae bacterium]